MRASRRAFTAFLLVLATAGAAPPVAADPASPFAPDPAFAELGSATADMRDSLPLPLLVDASLLASGIDPALLPAYRAKVEALLAALAARMEGARPAGGALASPAAPPAATGELVLEFLHAETFKRYEADATGLDLVLDAGRFNCLSSALLYLIAARAAGVDARGVRTADHAFCVLPAGPGGGKDVDVETTNRYGYDPGNKKEFRDSFGKVTGYAYAPPGAYSKRETMGDAAFVALVLSNRAGLLERSGRYLEALRLGADYAALAPGPESAAFLLDRVGNVASERLRKGDYAGARAFVERARTELGDSARLASLARDAAMAEAASLAQAGRYDEALDLAEALAVIRERDPGADRAARKELASLAEACVGNLANLRLKASDFAGARAVLAARRSFLEAVAGAQAATAIERRIAEAELADEVGRLPFAEALAALGEAERALAAGRVSRQRWEEAAAYLYGAEANRLSAAGDLLGAAAVAEAGAARAPGRAAPLSRFAAELRRAFAARSHNEFARLFNARDYAAALEAVRAALALLPGDPTLAADLAAAVKATTR